MASMTFAEEVLDITGRPFESLRQGSVKDLIEGVALLAHGPTMIIGVGFPGYDEFGNVAYDDYVILDCAVYS